ncbi:MAG: ATP synthase F1 subunit epsilon [Actinobacteria bacterium]|nr:ATP synthase F1 subunit epsilon [Actinomycetota bacterium]
MAVNSQDRSFLRVEVVDPDGLVFEGDVAMVVIPAAYGEIGILPQHAPLVAMLDIGELRVKTLGDQWMSLAVAEGFAMVQQDRIIILADSAELATEIDEDKAIRARDRALANLAMIKEGRLPEGQEKLYPFREQKALKAALNQLKVLRKV